MDDTVVDTLVARACDIVLQRKALLEEENKRLEAQIVAKKMELNYDALIAQQEAKNKDLANKLQKVKSKAEFHSTFNGTVGKNNWVGFMEHALNMHVTHVHTSNIMLYILNDQLSIAIVQPVDSTPASQCQPHEITANIQASGNTHTVIGIIFLGEDDSLPTDMQLNANVLTCMCAPIDMPLKMLEMAATYGLANNQQAPPHTHLDSIANAFLCNIAFIEAGCNMHISDSMISKLQDFRSVVSRFDVGGYDASKRKILEKIDDLCK